MKHRTKNALIVYTSFYIVYTDFNNTNDKFRGGFCLKLFKTGSKVAIAWILSYMIVLLTPTLASFLIYSRYSKTLTDQTEQFNQFIAYSMGENIKNVLVSVRKLYANVSFNNYLPFVLEVDNKDDYFGNNNVAKLLNDFSSYNTYKVNYSFFYLYINETDTVISDAGVFDSEYYYSVYFDKSKISYDDWKAIHTKKTTGYNTIDAASSAAGSNLIAYIMPLPKKVLPTGKTVSLSVMVDKDAFFNTASSVKWLSICDIYIFDNQDRLFLSTDNNFDKSYNQTPDEFTRLKTDEGYIVLKNKISYDTATMTLVSVGNPSSMAEVIVNMKRFSAISLVVCLLISILAMVYFIRRNYRPVEELLSVLGISKTKNEYTAMRKSIEQILSENELLQSTSQKQLATLRISTLSRILKGSYFGGYDKETLAENNILFKDGYFMVLSFTSLDLNSFFSSENLTEEEKFKELQFILTNVFEELFNTEQSTGYILDVDNEIFGVISYVGIKDEMQSFVFGKTTYGLNIINKQFNTFLSVSASDIHDSVSKLGVAYRECLYTMEYKRIRSIETTLSYTSIKKDEQSDYLFSLEKEKNLINCICVGNYSGAAACIDEIFQQISKDENMSLESAKFLMIDIAASILKLPEELSDSVSECMNAFAPSQILLYCDSISTLRERMLRAVRDICEAIGQKRDNRNLVSEIVEYVHKNYNNPTLSVTLIGNHFDMYPSYLSKLFKEQSGEALLAFINKFRIVKAKELIRTTDKNFSEIALAVGYYHVRTFTRIFKQYEGITPGMYKSSLK